MNEPSRHRIVVASDQTLVADVLCASLGDFGFDLVGWPAGTDAEVRDAHAGLLVTDLGSSDCCAYAEGVLAGAAVPWVVVAATPPPAEWLERLAVHVHLLPPSVRLAELADALHEAAERAAVAGDVGGPSPRPEGCRH